MIQVSFFLTEIRFYSSIKQVLTLHFTRNELHKLKDEIVATAAKFGANPKKPIVLYCLTEIKAAVLYMAMKEIVGFQNVCCYAGVYTEWDLIT